jgi:L-aspartate oxidase
VFGARAGLAARDEADPGTAPLPAKALSDLPPKAFQQLRRAMSRDAGVMRDRAGLERLLAEIDALTARHGAALALVAARIVAQAALERTESRGAHYRPDFPGLTAPARRTVLTLAELESRRVRAAEPAE